MTYFHLLQDCKPTKVHLFPSKIFQNLAKKKKPLTGNCILFTQFALFQFPARVTML